MSNFWQRLLTGAVFVAVMLGAIFFDFTFWLFLIIQALGLWEFYGHALPGMPKWKRGLYTALGCFIFNIYIPKIDAFYLVHQKPGSVLSLLLVIFFFVASLELFSKQDKPLQRVAFSIFGWLYLTIPFMLGNEINTFHVNEIAQIPILAGILILIWSNDTFAYVTGRTFGKTQLTPISPKKTIEGTIGGIVITLIIAWFLADGMGVSDKKPLFLVFTLITCLLGIAGDLTKSMFKRQWGIKDSGNILPGHGGILDRFDSFIFVMPFAYWWWSNVF